MARKKNRAMNIFTDRFLNQQPKVDIYKDILNNIAYTGHADTNIKLMVAKDKSQILDFSPGTPRINRSLISKFKLILEQPFEVSDKILCDVCGKAIIYPCWYHIVKFRVNHIAHFICYDPLSPEKPTARCYSK